MTYSIVKQTLAPQRVLVVRRRVGRSQIAATIGECLGRIFGHAQQNGIALSGLPFTRYCEVGPGLLTMEPGIRVTGEAPPDSDPAAECVEGEVRADTLPGGDVATTIHEGPYETLPDAWAALEGWIASEGLTVAGAPWESYLTDPAETPDPKDWKTEICWPVR